MISIPFLSPRKKVTVDDKFERELQFERHRLNNSAQALASGSRVMENMAGMMQLMARTKAIPDD